MFGRPIPIWLILGFLAYIALGTTWNLVATLGVGASSVTLHSVFGAVIAGLASWLAVEIWLQSRRILRAALANLGFTVVYYSLIAAGFATRGFYEGIVSAAIIGTILAAIWLAIFYYLKGQTKNHV
ncbi:hypothetical protein [Labrenzia sp. DG1229]|uniref:hypothetical protein n=1 Tax=Labrenzia sp. DG1229 TaxID=681847 RepID=UPI00048D80FA|nr:hypothetical protein [Labrenzia sp. DG1229]